MVFRWNRLSSLNNFHTQRHRRKTKKRSQPHARRATFFERLEERLVLNGIPIAKDDLSYFTAVNTALNIGSGNPTLIANDSDPEGSSLTASIVGHPSHGTISSFSGSAGTLTYTPDTG